MTRYKHKISLEKFNAYRDNQANSIEFTAKTSASGSGLLWMDQNVLFGNTAFQVRKRCELPKKFKDNLKETGKNRKKEGKNV
jgi:hypothetical protein